MASTTLPIALTSVQTSPELPLGYKFEEPASGAGARADQGEKVWVYVFNDEASAALAIGDICVRDPSVATQDMYGVIQAPINTAAHALSVVGVAQHAIAAGSYGFIQCKGQALCRTGTGDVTADVSLVSGGSALGSAKDGTLGTDDGCFFGFALEAEATDLTTFDAYINCPGA